VTRLAGYWKTPGAGRSTRLSDLAELRVCFIAGTLGQGGAERQLYYMVRALQDNGSRVRVLALDRGGFWESRIAELGVPITWVGEWHSKPARLARIIWEASAEKPHILQSQHFYTNLYAALSARAVGAREIGAIRSNGVREVESNGLLLGLASLRLPRLIAANSQAAMHQVRALGASAGRLVHLPNMIDCEYFRPETNCRDAVIVACVGRLQAVKRIDRFLRAIAQVRRQSSVRVRAIIAGDGPLQGDLERQAKELGLGPEAVVFEGSVADVRTIYRRSDLVMLTSDWEGSPNVLLEAMASGLPVVATRVGGVPEIVLDCQVGFLVEPSDEDGLAAALAQLIEDEGLRRRMGRQARKYVQANHSTERLPELLQSLYRVALS
jgi:glycosyltransferase involved in cell wall biosynthesis